MANTKFLDKDGLEYLVGKINEKFVDTTEVRDPIKWDSTNEELYLDTTDKLMTATGGKLDIDLSKVAGETMLVDNTNGGITLDVGTGLKTETDSGNTGKKKVSVDLDGIAGDSLTVNNDDTIDVNLTEIAGTGITVVNNKLTVDSYILPTATSTVKGGAKIGNGLEMVASDSEAPSTLDKLQAKAGNTTIIVDVNGIKVNPSDVAVLGIDGKVKPENLPSYVDDVIEGYFVPGDPTAEPPTSDIFYLTRTGSGTEQDPYVYTNPLDPQSQDPDMRPQESKIYVDLPSTDTFRWSGSVYVNISGSAYDIISNSEIDDLFD